MRRILFPVLIATMLLVITFGMFHVARSQGEIQPDGSLVLNSESQGENIREISTQQDVDAPTEPNISFIDSPTAACYQPDRSRNECYINWYYMYVSADPNYMITMTTRINSIGFVARYSGFFQTSMYVPYNMVGDGYKVACGALGAGGNSQFGNAYAYTIRARDSAGLSSANYGTVLLPSLPAVD